MSGNDMQSVGVVVSTRAHETFESRSLNGQEEQVDKIKTVAALLFDQIDAIALPPEKREAARLVALAKTNLEQTVMWAVKACSRNH